MATTSALPKRGYPLTHLEPSRRLSGRPASRFAYSTYSPVFGVLVNRSQKGVRNYQGKPGCSNIPGVPIRRLLNTVKGIPFDLPQCTFDGLNCAPKPRVLKRPSCLPQNIFPRVSKMVDPFRLVAKAKKGSYPFSGGAVLGDQGNNQIKRKLSCSSSSSSFFFGGEPFRKPEETKTSPEHLALSFGTASSSASRVQRRRRGWPGGRT